MWVRNQVVIYFPVFFHTKRHDLSSIWKLTICRLKWSLFLTFFLPKINTHKQLSHNIFGAIKQGCRGTILFSTQYLFVIFIANSVLSWRTSNLLKVKDILIINLNNEKCIYCSRLFNVFYLELCHFKSSCQLQMQNF